MRIPAPKTCTQKRHAFLQKRHSLVDNSRAKTVRCFIKKNYSERKHLSLITTSSCTSRYAIRYDLLKEIERNSSTFTSS